MATEKNSSQNCERAAKRIQALARAVSKGRDWQARYRALGEEAARQASAIRADDSTAVVDLLLRLGAAAGEIGGAGAVFAAGTRPEERLLAVHTLAGACDEVSTVLCLMLRSAKFPSADLLLQNPEASNLAKALDRAQPIVNETAFAFFMTATRLLEAAGSPPSPDRKFRVPYPTSGCGCGEGEGVSLKAIQTLPRRSYEFHLLTAQPDLPTAQMLRPIAQELLENTLLLNRTLQALAGVVILAFISFCSSGCTPPLTFLSPPVRLGATSCDGEPTNRPQFELIWDYCCQNVCFIVWTDEFIVTVDTSHFAGNNLGPGRGRAALQRATVVGAATVAALNATPPGAIPAGIVPAPAAPPAPAC